MSTENGIYTPSPTPKPHPRVRPEAAENANRQRDAGNWFSHDGGQNYHSPQPKERNTSDEARRNAQTNKGSLGDIMSGKSNNTPDFEVHHRIKPEAEEFANRNRGTMDKWFDYSQNQRYESPRPGERLRTEEAKKVAEVNKGVMNECMGGYADPPVKKPIHPRSVKAEAAEMAERGKGGAMKDLMVNYGNMNLEEGRQGPKVKGMDAEEYAERNKGTVSKLMNNYADVPLPEQPAPKVYYGGEEVLDKYQGKDMGPMLRMEGRLPQHEPKVSRLHKESEGPGWDENPPAVRARPEGDRVADKYHDQHVKNLKVMDMEAPPPTVRPTKVPVHLQESGTPRPKTSPTRTRPEGRFSYQKNQSSEMFSIMKGESNQASTPRKVNRMMQRSENW